MNCIEPRVFIVTFVNVTKLINTRALDDSRKTHFSVRIYTVHFTAQCLVSLTKTMINESRILTHSRLQHIGWQSLKFWLWYTKDGNVSVKNYCAKRTFQRDLTLSSVFLFLCTASTHFLRNAIEDKRGSKITQDCSQTHFSVRQDTRRCLLFLWLFWREELYETRDYGARLPV